MSRNRRRGVPCRQSTTGSSRASGVEFSFDSAAAAIAGSASAMIAVQRAVESRCGGPAQHTRLRRAGAGCMRRAKRGTAIGSGPSLVIKK